MAPRQSTESKHLLRLLSDGQWHDLEAIRERVAAKVAPGRALRKYETRTLRHERKRGPRIKPPPTDEQKVAMGSRLTATIVINSLKTRWLDVQEGPDGSAVRIRPEMVAYLPKILGQGLSPEAAEAAAAGLIRQWDHKSEASPQQPVEGSGEPPESTGSPDRQSVVAAVYSEAQLRLIVASELGRALDQTQLHLERYLAGSFAVIERKLDALSGRQKHPGGSRKDRRR